MQRMKARTATAGLNQFRRLAIISSFVVFPFIILEFINMGPFPDFARSFLTALAAGLSVVALVLIAYAWVGIVVDQMPCFLGRPNCD